MNRIALIRRTVGSLALAALPAALSAQDASHAEPLVPIHTASAWNGHAYGIWAAAPSYKASFHDGATFVPYLGDAYPHNQPWSWRTTSVRIGGRELVEHAPRLRHDGGLRAEYDLGAVVEAYDVQRAGLEQTFVIADRPATITELVVRGHVETLLTASPCSAQHRELAFFDGRGDHILTYGAATAIDAHGRRRPMTTAFDGEVITLRLDAQWLETATFPVVVDPLLGTGAQVAGSSRRGIDVAHDPISSYASIWMCYSASASILDSDTFCHRFNIDGSSHAAVFADVSANWNTVSASTAMAPSPNAAVIVCARNDGTTREIAMHEASRNTSTLGTGLVTVPTGGFPSYPAIGGVDNTNGGDRLMIVWQQDSNYSGSNSSDIQGMLYDAANDTFGNVIAIAGSPLLTDYERPSINRNQRFTPASWRVAFQSVSRPLFGVPTDDWDVGVVKVADDETASAITWLDSSFNGHQFRPKIDGEREHYVVAYVAEPPTPGSIPTDDAGTSVRYTRLVWPDADAAGTEPHAIVDSFTTTQPDSAVLGGIAVDREYLDRWVLTLGNTATNGYFVRLIGHTGAFVRQETLTTSPDTVLGGVAFNHSLRNYPIGYAQNGSLFGGYVTTNRFAYPATTPPQVTGSSCSSAQISWLGQTLIGHGHSKVEVANAPSLVLQTVAVSTGTASQSLNAVGPFQTGCNLLVDPAAPNFLFLLAASTSSTEQWQFPLPEFLPNGAVLYFQGFHTDGTTNFVFQTTRRLEVTLTK